MAIPDYQTVMLPLLTVLADGRELFDVELFARLMVKINVGVAPTIVYEVKRLDTAFSRMSSSKYYTVGFEAHVH